MRGALQIVRYNWPAYAAAAIVASALGALLAFGAPSPATRGAAWAGIALAAWLTAASLCASYWVYDRSALVGAAWLDARWASPGARWASVHAGLDESTADLEARLGRPPEAVLDVFDAAAMTERSIRRARGERRADKRTRAAAVDRLPLADESCGLAFCVLAAHELRAAAPRAALFAELRRALAPGGRVIVVEHLRDLANGLAFGPGALHFLSRATWLATFERAGLRPVEERRITPFVHVFVLSARSEIGPLTPSG